MRDDIRKRYQNDAKYHATVDMMRMLLANGTITTHELAEAAVFACQLHAEQNLAPLTVLLVDRTSRPERLRCTCGALGLDDGASHLRPCPYFQIERGLVHVLLGGMAACGAGTPSDWPNARWARESEKDDATCEPCRAAVEKLRVERTCSERGGR